MQFAAIPAASNSLPAIVHLPLESTGTAAWVLHLPAFADEMNKARPMVHQTATALAAKGIAVVVPDFHGCGDAPGEFRDADWHQWQSDVEHVTRWMTDSLGASEITLWGLRLGCLMAVEIASKKPELISGLTFWQPVLDGKQFLNQFLRIRVAAAMFRETGETLSSLRSDLMEQGRLTVGGYELALPLYEQINELHLRHFLSAVKGPVNWFELHEGDLPKPNLPTQKLISEWRDQGADISLHTVKGARFWATQEIAMAPALMEATVEALTQKSADSSSSTLASRPQAMAAHGAAWATDGGEEKGVVFTCEDSQLAAVFHAARQHLVDQEPEQLGLVMVVGGPQYRVGSHRHFVQLGRALAAAGFPVLRFDYRGMGDSGGELTGFEHITADIAAAVAELQQMAPTVSRVALFGLCDAATAISQYAGSDERIRGLILLNPWVFSEAGNAQAMLGGYYLRRLGSKQFWRKLIAGGVSTSSAVTSLLENLAKSMGGGSQRTAGADAAEPGRGQSSGSLAQKMASGLQHFKGEILLVLSGRDLTADEFKLTEARTPALIKTLNQPRAVRLNFAEADHTFSEPAHKAELTEQILTWLKKL